MVPFRRYADGADGNGAEAYMEGDRNMRTALTASLALAGMVFAAAAANADGHADREKYMKGLGGHMGFLGKIAKGEAPYTPEAVTHAEALVAESKKLLALFPPGTEPTGRAKPEIWTDWAKFEAAAKDFQDAAPKLVPAAKSGDAKQIAAALGDVGKTCGGCHKPFRKPES